MKKIHFFLFLLAGLWAGCTHPTAKEDNNAVRCAEKFSTAFFNFDFKQAFSLCLPKEDGWLRMYVSSMGEEDAANIRKLEKRPQIALGRIDENDNTARIWANVENAYLLDSIGRAGYVAPHATLRMDLVRQQGKWRVRRADLLQSGM